MEQYIRTSRYRDIDQWTVYFSNKHGLSVEEIDQISSKFVIKKKINQTGDANGLCFINLFSYEDAVKCVKGLQGHESIQLKKHVKDRGELKKNDTKIETNKIDFKYNETYKTDLNNCEIYENNSTNEIKCNKEENLTNNYLNDVMKSPKMINKLLTDLKTKNVIGTITYDYLNQEFQEKKCVEVEPKIPELVLKKSVFNKSSFENTITERMIFAKETRELFENMEAEELIIANVDEDYGTNYILYLLEKYQPICASFMKVSERYALRYCHVYFTSNQYISEVQKSFDNLELGTKNLIVLYVDRLKGILSL